MSKPRPSPRLSVQIREEATEWLIAFCEGEVDAAAREDFNRWLRSSPEHVRAYVGVSAFWEQADRIDSATQRDIKTLIASALAESNVIALSLPASRGATQAGEPAWTRSRRRVAVAASVLIAGLALFTWLQWHRFPSYATMIGEHRTIALADGSSVTLNARSRINIRFTESQRRIDLLEGQALFRVAHDAARPFFVESQGVSVRAVGTQFDVYRKPGGTVVSVLEGRVAVLPEGSTSSGLLGRSRGPDTPNRLTSTGFVSAGEQVIVTAQTVIRSQQPAALAAATAWKDGLMIFNSAPLREVVDEFNRQNIKPMTIGDAELRELQISGTFPANGTKRLTDFLRERFAVVVRETDGEIRIDRE